MTTDKRQSVRTPFQAKVRVTIGDDKPITLGVQDVSDGGIFVDLDTQAELSVGSVLKVQLLGMPVEAPIREMEVVNVRQSGAGLRFVESFD